MQVYYKSKRYDLGALVRIHGNGLSLLTVKRRILRGWSVEKALSKPSQTKEVAITDHKGNSFSSIKELCRHYHFSEKLFRHRRFAGWDIERILTEPKHRYTPSY